MVQFQERETYLTGKHSGFRWHHQQHIAIIQGVPDVLSTTDLLARAPLAHLEVPTAAVDIFLECPFDVVNGAFRWHLRPDAFPGSHGCHHHFDNYVGTIACYLSNLLPTVWGSGFAC